MKRSRGGMSGSGSSWVVDAIRATRYGGNFMRPPDAAAKRRQATRRRLAKAGKPVTSATLPEPERSPTPAQQAKLERIDRIRESIGKVDFSVADLIREMREGGRDLHR